MPPPNQNDLLFLYRNYKKFIHKRKHQYGLLTTVVLPWLELNNPAESLKGITHPQPDQRPASFWEQLKGYHPPKNEQEQREMVQGLLLKWWQALLDNVFKVGYDERSVYFDCVCEIIMRPEFRDLDNRDKAAKLQPNSNQEAYENLLSVTLEMVKKKLDHTAVFADMMKYSAKILAICFFKVPDLATTILCGLDVRPVWIHRLQQEMGPLLRLDETKENMKTIFPPFFHPLIGASGWKYQQFIHSLKPNAKDLSSVWMERLKRTSGEIYTLFFKQLHVVMATYLVLICPEAQKERLQYRNSMLMAAPCYLYFSGYFLHCIETFISHMIHSLTLDTANDSSDNLASLMSTKPHYDSNDEMKKAQGGESGTETSSDALKKKPIQMKSLCDYQSGPHGYHRKRKKDGAVSGRQHHGKPQVLEELTWVYSECLAWCVMMAEPCGRYHDLINVMIRALVLATEVGNAIAVFGRLRGMVLNRITHTSFSSSMEGIFDFMEATMLQLQHYRLQIHYYPPLDLPFLIHTIHVVLAYSDHSTSLLRVLSFVYAQFKILASRAGLLDYLCNRILLDPVVFERLFLHWGANVRNFYWRCLIWRVGCVWKPQVVCWSSDIIPVAKQHGISVCDGAICKKDGFMEYWDDYGLTGFEKTSTSYIKVESMLRQHSTRLTHVILETLFESFHLQYRQYQKDQQLHQMHLGGWEAPRAVVPYSLMQSVLTDSPTSLILELTSNKKMNTQCLVRSNTRQNGTNTVPSPPPSLHSTDSSFIDTINNVRRRSIASITSSTSRQSAATTTYEHDGESTSNGGDDGDDDSIVEDGRMPISDPPTTANAPYRDIWYQYYAVPLPLVDPIIATAPTRQYLLRAVASEEALTTLDRKKQLSLDTATLPSGSDRLILLRGSDGSKYVGGKVINNTPNKDYVAANTISRAKQWRYNSCHHSYARQQMDVSGGLYQEYLQNRKRGIPKLLLDWPLHWVVDE